MTRISYEQQMAMGLVKGAPREFVAPAPATQSAPAALPPQTALVPVQPIKPGQLTDSFNGLVGLYAQQYKQAAKVGEVLPAHDTSAPRGYSSAAELGARNQRFFVTIGAMVGVAAFAMWGIVSVAHAAGFVGDNWTLPLWIALTGCSAFLTIHSVHGSEQRLAPENIELVRAENEFAIQHMDAQTRQLAINLAAQIDLERVQLERERADLQRQQANVQTLETKARIADQMARHTTPQATYNRLNTYRPTQQGTQQGVQDRLVNATNAPGTPVNGAVAWYADENEVDGSSAVFELDYEVVAPEPDSPEVADPVRQALLDFTMEILLAYKNDDQGRKVYQYINPDGQIVNTVVPWSKRGGMSVGQRRQAGEILRQITPWLYEQRNNSWCVNLRYYKRVGDAVDAIGNAYTPSI